MAIETNTDLKTLPLPTTEKWLMVGLDDLSKGTPLINSLSTMIPNFIVNTGGARAEDILALMDLAREKVREETGIELEPEIKVVGK